MSQTALAETLRAEWTKLRTLPGTGWLLVAVAALTIAVSAAADAARPARPPAARPTRPRSA